LGKESHHCRHILYFLHTWKRNSPCNPNLVSKNVDLEENSTCRTQANFRLQLSLKRKNPGVYSQNANMFSAF
jgi:hypothetical protein